MLTQPRSGEITFGRIFLVLTLIATLYVAGCATQAANQFSVTTSSGQLATVVVNTAYPGTTLTASNGTAPYMWAIASGALPTGLTLSSSGVLSGTPTASGTFNFAVMVTDSGGKTASANLSVSIDPVLTAVTVTSPVTAGNTTSGTVSLNGPAPAGGAVVNLKSSNTSIATVPATVTVAAGTTSVTFTVTTPSAGTGGQATITGTFLAETPQTGNLTVNHAPAITSANNTAFAVGAAGTFTVTVTGTPTATLSENGALPSGVNFNAATGVLSGTPAPGSAGSYAITFSAQNGISPNATQNFTLNVDQAPSITSGNSTTFTAGSAGSFTVAATGFPAPTFSETGSLPTGVTLNSSTGVLGGTPAANTGAVYNITISATNGIGTPASQSFTLTVNQPPAITSANNATFNVGSAGTFTVTASGFPAPTLGETGALPNGVAFNPATGVLSGTPATGTQGSYPISITAANGVGTTATQSFTLNVDLAPTITSGNSTTFTAGSAGTFTVTASGFPAPTFSETGALPTGVTLNPTTGVLSGTPAANTGATYNITISAANGAGTAASQSFTLTVDQAPAITSANSTTFAVGASNTFSVTAAGFPAPTFGETGSLPSGVSFNTTTGVLSGTPASGTQNQSPYVITITASNGVGTPTSQTFTLTVSFTAPPNFTSSNSTTFTVGTPGTFTVTASGSPAPTFSVTSGSPPAGVTLNSTTGVLSGTPAANTGNVYTFTITAQNGISPNATQNFTLTVDQVPAITSGNSTTFTAGSQGTFTVTATGYPAPTFSETGSLPTGVSLNPTTGVLSGTPAAGTGGSYPITITAQNGVSPNSTQAFTLTVNSTPVFTSQNSTTFTVATAGSFTVAASGPPAPTFSVTNGSLPSGVTLSTAGVLSGTPAANTGGVYAVTITAHNGIGTDTTQSFTLTVDQAPAFTSVNSITFGVGASSSFTVTTAPKTNPTAALSESGALPTGITFVDNGNGTATLGGIPATGTQNTYPITLIAQNGVGSPVTQSFTLTVSTNTPPAFTSSNSTTFTVGTPSTFSVTASGYPAPALSESGSLPQGVTFTDNGSGNGTLGGTAAAGNGGVYSFTLTANNGVGGPVTQNFTLTIDEGPSFQSDNSATFFTGAPSSFNVFASGTPSPALSETGSLPSGVTFTDNGNGNGSLSGTPSAGSVGTYNITLTAHNGITADASQSFTLTVAAPFTCPLTTLGQENLLNGSYALLFSGFGDADGPLSASAPLQVTGVFTASGTGNITAGEADGGNVYSNTNPQAQLQTISGGCYNLGSDHRGHMVWNFSGGGSITFSIVVRADGTLGRLIEFDDSNPTTNPGSRGSGVFKKRTLTAPFSAASFSGPYAFGLTGANNDSNGSTANYQRMGVVGRFDAGGSALTITNGVIDISQINSNAVQNVDLVPTVAASSGFTAPDSLGRGTLTFTLNSPTVCGGPCSATLSYYLVGTGDVFLQGLGGSDNPFFNGEALAQSGTFNNGILSGNAVFSATGEDVLNHSYTVIEAGQVSSNGSGSASAYLDKFSNGSALFTGTTQITGGSFTVSSNGMGVLTIGSGGSAQPYSVVMISQNTGFLLEGTQASPGVNIITGLMLPQTAPAGGFSASTISGLFIEANTSPSTTNAGVGAGSVTLTAGSPTGSLSGSQDQSQGFGCGSSCLQLNRSITGTYSISSNGRLTVTPTGNSGGGGGSIFGWLQNTSHGALLDNSSNGLTIQLDQ